MARLSISWGLPLGFTLFLFQRPIRSGWQQTYISCGKENRKHVNRISGISLQVTSAKLYLGMEHPSDRENDKQQFSPQYVG